MTTQLATTLKFGLLILAGMSTLQTVVQKGVIWAILFAGALIGASIYLSCKNDS